MYDCMKKIKSFSVDHDVITKGMYISRIDGDVITYDVRMKTPNGGDYLSDGAMHTIEHLFATYARNSAFSDQIVYVGPMGCRTGFYLLTRDTMTYEQGLSLVRDAFLFMRDFSGEIPGSARKECGNYLDHDVEGAKAAASDFCDVLTTWNVEKLIYPDQNGASESAV